MKKLCLNKKMGRYIKGMHLKIDVVQLTKKCAKIITMKEDL